jgi:hypothetical protein
MEKHRRTVLDRIWVCVSREIGIIRADLGFVVVSLHHVLNEINKIKRQFNFQSSVAETDHIFVGDQLRWDVQQWLSPPDPSTNHNFVRKSRHSGTAAWFFESSALTEWKSRGSLLWIHGKRMFMNFQRVSCTNNFLIVKRGRGKAHFCM